MKILARLVAALIIALPVTMAFAQAPDDSNARLRLVLDPDGRVRLSTHAFDGYATPPMRQAPLPRLSPYADRQPGTGPELLLEIRADRSRNDYSLAPCLDSERIRLAPMAACESINTYDGLPGAINASNLSLALAQSDGLGVRLTYGLAWLDPAQAGRDANQPLTLVAPGLSRALLLPHQFEPLLGPTPLRSERFGITGFVPLGGGLRLDLGYAQSRGLNADFQPGIAPWLMGSQDSVSLGLGYGRFHGGLIGRQQRPLNPLQGGGSESLDLGLSWRMPWWNAELEFGARNLIVRPSKPDAAERPLEQGDLRTPYLRYHQEL